jgi:hypothetical protein
MDSDARLKAFARLAQSKTAAAQAALEKELDQVARTLESEYEYDLLAQSLEILDVIGYRLSERAVGVIGHFIQTIETRTLRYSRAGEVLPIDYIEKYRNARTLIGKAIEVLVHLRYYQTRAILRLLIDLSNHPSENIRKKVSNGLGALAKYDLDVFYGPDRSGGIGAAPQKQIIGTLEAESDTELKTYYSAALELLRELLSPTIEGASWSSKSVTLSRGQTPAIPDVSDIRARSIRHLKRLYGLAATKRQKLSTLSVLNGATRTERLGETDEKTSEMIVRDATDVLAFYTQLVPTEDLQIVQQIETSSYWIFVHANREEIRTAALAVEKVLAIHSEYHIYRVLVGFEGVFSDWKTLQGSDDQWSVTEKERRQRASEFAKSITSENFQEWRARILTFAKTESDDLATFPIFYHFLDEFSAAHPELALRLLTEDTAEISRFLIPILRGLWDGPRQVAVREVIERWIKEAKADNEHHLFASTKLFLSTKELDVGVLGQLLAKAIEIKDVATVRQCIAVAIVRFPTAGKETTTLKRLLFQALDVLTQEKDASWIYEAWFRGEARQLFADLDKDGLEHVLANLHVLPKIEYHAEELLSVIAQREPESVIQFFCQRISSEDVQGKRLAEFEGVPFQFHTLQEPLSKVPGAAVRAVLDLFRADASLFAFRGARLLANIFPNFPPAFEEELLQLVREGEETRHEFVLGILRNYHGEPFIHRLCKEIVKSIPSDSPLRTEVAVALETTGVVSGEFGMSETYERKRLEVLDWLNDSDERVQNFAKWYIEDLERMRDAEKKHADEDIALRKFQYGEE